MSNTRLTQRQIDALKPRKKTFDVRDTELKGFGVRIRCSGIKRYFVQSQHEGTRTWRIIGNAAEMTLEEARRLARSALASLHNGEEIIAVTDEETRFEVVARLLGHSQVSMTLRYAHVADKEVEAAAQRVGRVIANLCGISM